MNFQAHCSWKVPNVDALMRIDEHWCALMSVYEHWWALMSVDECWWVLMSIDVNWFLTLISQWLSIVIKHNLSQFLSVFCLFFDVSRLIAQYGNLWTYCDQHSPNTWLICKKFNFIGVNEGKISLKHGLYSLNIEYSDNCC